uniref:P-selectin isoform X2 n=1 Tax=Semicossyphus pulcher TaxID=241346 RepID=UPI0037E866A2
MMFEESVEMKQSLHHRVLIAALIVFAQDLSSRGGAQAWSYNYSSSPNRRWAESRQWCQQYFTDMVSIESKEENDFLNDLVPFSSKYYWIGISKVDGEWIWDRTNEKVPIETQNWAINEPDNMAGQDCVEMYIKREEDTGKWNNENCRKKKGTICYTASCKQDSCSAHADCVETIGNFTCQCHPGFQGPRCEEAIACKPLLDSDHGSHSCKNTFGSNRFNSSCHFHCDLGFHSVGVPQLLCQASGQWTHPVPPCQVEQCPVLNDTDIRAGRMNCSHPIAVYSYNSTCEVTCDEGHELKGQDQIRCDHTGQWTAPVPACTVKKCAPILFPVTGNMTCVDTFGAFSFASRCNFTCQEGYYLTGDNTLTCLASGQWSKPTPTCTVVKCNSMKAPSSASVRCQDPVGVNSYGSICSVRCEEGFDLIGANMTKCSSQGNWSHALPVCQAKKCPTLSSPSHGSLSCSAPHGEFRFGSRCTSTCAEGFVLNGTADADCTSVGLWSTDIPHCLARRCSTLSSPSHGSLFCSAPHGEFSFGSRCTSTCEEGFLLNGTADTDCTSLGMWSRKIPSCLAHPCPLLAKAPQHGRMNCSHPHSPFSFGSLCDIECDEGFRPRGKQTLTCSNMGLWSQEVPTCHPVQCGSVGALASTMSMNCSHPLRPFSFGSKCLFTCKDGYSLNGTDALFCSSSGSWNESLPRCTDEGMPLGTALLMYTGVGAASVAVPLLLTGLALLIVTRFKKRGNSIVSDAPTWGDRENPAFEF